MTVVEIRPRFCRNVSLPVDKVLENLSRALEQENVNVKGIIVDHHVTLKIPADEQHYWSPQLSLTIEEGEDCPTQIRGLFGPRPTVWMLFTFLYSSIGAICLFVSITGFSQMSLGIPAPVLWVLPIGAALATFLYVSAKAGERLGRDEMIRLKNFLNQALVDKNPVNV